MADEAGALQQEVGLETGDISPVALTDLEHAELRQRAYCLAQRVPGQPQLRRQLGFLRQAVARSPAAGDDQALNLVDRLRGHARVASCSACHAEIGHWLSIVRQDSGAAQRSEVMAHKWANSRVLPLYETPNTGPLA